MNINDSNLNSSRKYSISNKNESWGKHLLTTLQKTIDSNPITFELSINKVIVL